MVVCCIKRTCFQTSNCALHLRVVDIVEYRCDYNMALRFMRDENGKFITDHTGKLIMQEVRSNFIDVKGEPALKIDPFATPQRPTSMSAKGTPKCRPESTPPSPIRSSTDIAHIRRRRPSSTPPSPNSHAPCAKKSRVDPIGVGGHGGNLFQHLVPEWPRADRVRPSKFAPAEPESERIQSDSESGPAGDLIQSLRCAPSESDSAPLQAKVAPRYQHIGTIGTIGTIRPSMCMSPDWDEWAAPAHAPQGETEEAWLAPETVGSPKEAVVPQEAQLAVVSPKETVGSPKETVGSPKETVEPPNEAAEGLPSSPLTEAFRNLYIYIY